MKPKCIVLDEPTAMLDPNGRKEVLKTVKELNKQENVTVILITHYMNEVIDADKVFVMDSGKVVLEGTPREIFSRVSELKKLGLDVPQVTEIAHNLKNKGIDLGECVLSIKEFRERYKAVTGKDIADAKNSTLCETNMESKKLILEAKNLTYIYEEGTANEKGALEDVSLNIHEGEFLAIIGHTGSGKSTLIQHLNGLMKADSGAIYFNGEDIYAKEFSMPFLRKHVGLVFQYPEHQLFETTVFEDVCFGPKNLGLSKDEVADAARKALKQVGLGEEYYEKSPFELSGGEKRRVAIAGVLAMNPEVLILDEPTAGLDPKGRDKILNRLKKLQTERNIAIVLVSHSMEDVAKYAERLVVMSGGKKLYDGDCREVFSHYKELEEIGLAAPQVTYLMAESGKTVMTVDEAVDLLA